MGLGECRTVGENFFKSFGSDSVRLLAANYSPPSSKAPRLVLKAGWKGFTHSPFIAAKKKEF